MGTTKPPILPPTSQKKLPSFLKYGFTSILGLCLGAQLVVSLIKYLNPPEKSIAALAAAVKRHDRKGVETYVDAPALAVSMRKFARNGIELQEKIKAKQNSDDFFVDRFLGMLVKPIGNKIISEMIDRMLTPKNLVDMMSGESESEIMKKSLTGMADNLTDASIEMTDPKTKIYAPAIKLVLGFCADALVDAVEKDGAQKDRKAQDIKLTEKDIKTIKLYEAPNRYVIMYKVKTPNPDIPVFALVYERHGLTVWKWTEIRMLPSDAVQ